MGKITKKFQEKYYGFLFHYYRAEVYRETAWRNRLDITTNWSIVITAAILSFVFSNVGISHTVIIINYLIVLCFLYIEARRFRYYFLVRDRVKIFEKHILGSLFNFEKHEDESEKWISDIADKLVRPKIKMSRIEALSWRLRKSYVFILPIIFIVWIYKVYVFPKEAGNLNQFLNNAKVGFIPGYLVLSFMIASITGAIIIAYYVSSRHVGNDLP